MDTKHPLGTFSIPNVAKAGIRTWQQLIVPLCARESVIAEHSEYDDVGGCAEV